MNIEWAKLLITPFIYLLVIIIAALLIWLFRFELLYLKTYLDIRSVKVAGVEITLASAEINQAVEKAIRDNRIADLDGEEVARTLEVFTKLAAPYVSHRRILWVDDEPLNNSNERRAFRFLGIDVENCLTTPEAIDALRRDNYDLVISDVTRRNMEDDGWRTLNEVQGLSPIPFIFYHRRLQEQEERDGRAIREGAIGATTSPATLYQWVLSAFLYEAIIRDDSLRHLLMLIPRKLRHRL